MQQDEAQMGAPAKTPISAHPAFPLIVGLWFAALLGLGTIVLPAVVLEKAAGASGLSSVFPQAAAPLTAGARAAFALLATILGLVGGLALAHRVAATQVAARAPRRRAPNAPPRPLSVHDDLGEEAIAPTLGEQRKPLPGRRRSLAAMEDERPSDFLLAPLPGSEAISPPELPADEDEMSERPSDIAIPAHDGDAVEELDAAEPYVPSLDTRKPRDFAAPPPPEAAGEVLEPLSLEPIDAPLEDLGMVQLAERLGRSMHRRLSQPKPLPEPEEETLVVPPPVVPEALRAFMDGPPEDFAPQALAAEVPEPVIPTALQSFAFAAFNADEDDEDHETHDPGPFTLPLASMPRRPFDAPMARAANAEPLLVEDEADDDNDDEDEIIADESYSSLLTMTSPFRAAEEFVRIDEPEESDDEIEPAVVFPSQEPVVDEAVSAENAEAAPVTNIARPFDAPHQPAPSTAPVRARTSPDPVETERALRSALANLQRMSGTA